MLDLLSREVDANHIFLKFRVNSTMGGNWYWWKNWKKIDVNYRWTVSNQAVISVNSKLFYLKNSNDLEYFLASAPHTHTWHGRTAEKTWKKRHKDVDNIVVTPKWLLPKYNKRMMHVSLLSCSPFPSWCLAWHHFL